MATLEQIVPSSPPEPELLEISRKVQEGNFDIPEKVMAQAQEISKFVFLSELDSKEEGANAISIAIQILWSVRFLYRKLEGYEQPEWGLALNSLLASKLSFQLAVENEIVFAHETALCSALREVGKVFTDFNISVEKDKVFNKIFNEKKTFWQAEKEVIKTPHTDVGAFAVARWGFAGFTAICARYFRIPWAFTAKGTVPKIKDAKVLRKMIYTVHIADTITQIVGQGTGIDAMLYVFDRNALKITNTTERKIEQLVVSVNQEVGFARKLLEILRS